MITRSRIAALTLAFAVASAACSHTSPPTAPAAIGSLPEQLPRGRGPRLVVPKELRLARQVPEAMYLFEVPVANGGDRSLDIREVRTGCLCTGVRSYPRRLRPGERGMVAFRFDSSWDGPGEHGDAIDFVTNDPAYGDTRLPMAHDRWVFFTVGPTASRPAR